MRLVHTMGRVTHQSVAAASRAFLAPMRPAHYAFALLAALGYWLLMLWGAGEYLVTTPYLHDQTTPGSAVFAWRNNLELHSDLRSPFGFFYFWHYGAAARLAEVVAPNYSIFDVQTTAHAIMFALLLALMRLMESVARARFPLWLAALLGLAFFANTNPTVLSQLHWSRDYNAAIHWAFAYNTYLCSLFLLLAYVLWQAWRRENDRRYAAQTLLAAGAVFFALLYKINFAFGAMALWGGWWLAQMPSLRAMMGQWRAWTSLAALFLCAIGLALAAVQAVADYDLRLYADDLQAAFHAKNVQEYRIGNLQGAPLVLALIVFCVWLSRRFLGCGRGWLRLVAWWGGLWGGMFLCAAGASPVMQYFLFMMAASLAFGGWLHWLRLPGFLRGVAVLALALLLFGVGAAVGEQVAVKTQLAREEYVTYSSSRLRYATPAGLTQRMHVFPLDAPADAPATAALESDVVVRRIGEMKEIYSRWRPVMGATALSVMGLENHVPFFTDIPPPAVFSHWKFVYNSFHRDDARALHSELDAANIVLLPAYHLEEFLMYPACWFLYESGAAADFAYAGRTGQWFVFARRDAIIAPAVAPPLRAVEDIAARPVLMAHCRDVLERPPFMPPGAKTFLYPYLEAAYSWLE